MEAELTEHLGHPPGGVPQGRQRPQRRDAQDGADRSRARSRSRRRATATAALSRSWWPSARPGWRAWTRSPRPLRRRHDRPRHQPPPRPSSTAPRSAATRSAAITDAVLEDVAGVAHPAAGRGLSDRLLRRDVRQGPRGPLGQEPRLLPRAGRHLRRRARGPRDLVAGDRGREVLAGRPQRPAPPRRRGRPDRLRRRPEGLPRGDRGDVPAGLGADLHRAPHPRLACATSTTATARRSPPRCGRSTPPPTPTPPLAELDALRAPSGAPRYPPTVQAWRASWEHVIPFLALPDELRRAVYTTNTIEGLHRQIRKAIKTRGHFPDEQAATKLIYLALIKADAKWQRNRAWTAARAALKIHFGDRFPG